MKVCLHPNPEMWSLEAVFMAPLFIFGKFQTFGFFIGVAGFVVVVVVVVIVAFVFFGLISSY